MKLFTLIFTVTALTTCSSQDDNEVTVEPECLQEIVDGILNTGVSTPKRSISSYNYNEQLVYVITPSSFSQQPASNVVNASCNTICLIGSIDGKENECEGFENAEFIETIWTDPR